LRNESAGGAELAWLRRSDPFFPSVGTLCVRAAIFDVAPARRRFFRVEMVPIAPYNENTTGFYRINADVGLLPLTNKAAWKIHGSTYNQNIRTTTKRSLLSKILCI
jgi:hypothetical protein